jgi:tetratricopeptide (TPR) repeat protein
MLRAEETSRGRIRLLAGSVLVLLGGFVLTGLIQRVLPTPTETAADPVNTTAIAAEARRVREARKSLAALGRKHRWAEVAAAADDYLKKDDHPWIRGLRAEAYFRLGKRERAADDFQRLIGFNPVETGSLMAVRGDREGYRRECAEALRKADVQNTSPVVANNAAWVCVVGQDALKDYSVPVRLAEQAVAKAERPEDRFLYLNTLGVALYRAGQDRDAVARLTEAEKIHSDPFNWPVLALAYHRLGQEEAASRWLARLRQRLDATYGTPDPQPFRHELLLFWQEAEDKIAAR